MSNETAATHATPVSEGLHFVRAGYNASALESDKRVALHEMKALLIAAIRGRMPFDMEDGVELARLAATGAIPGFDPFHKGFYDEARLAGSTYYGMWRRHQERLAAQS